MKQANSSATVSEVCPASRIRRQARRVHPHASGSWTCSIGKQVSKDGTRLVRKDWYFPKMTEAEATAQAQRIQAKWEFVVKNWARVHQPNLELLDLPFPSVPHWPSEQKSGGDRGDVRVIELPPTAEDLYAQYARMNFAGVAELYKSHLRVETAQGQRQNVTLGAIEKNLRNALAYFGPQRVDELTFQVVQAVKGEMLDKLGRRTVGNYLGELKKMLDWFYGSDYGGGHERPPHFEDAFAVRAATRTDIKVHGATELKAVLERATRRTKLFVMLALNAGMYQADIGRLELAEVDLQRGHVFWDRSKEPANPFRVRHDLWAETLVLVREFIQAAGQPKRPFTDYRELNATEVDCAQLAFVDGKGLPLYRVRKNGDTYDKISGAWKDLKAKLPTAPRFKDIRKSTNQLLCELLEGATGDLGEGLEAVGEISKTFLAQKTPGLARLYRLGAVKLYNRMNKYLAAVGDQLRAQGVFESI